MRRARKFPGSNAASTVVPPNVVREGGTNNAASVSSLAVTVPTGGHAAGNSLIVVVHGQNNVATGVADSRGNTYTRDAVYDDAGLNAHLAIFRAPLTTALQAGDTVTATMTASNSRVIVQTLEISGLAASPVDQTVTNFSASVVTALDGGTTADTTHDLDIAVSAFALAGTAIGAAAGSGWTKLTDLSVGGSRSTIWQYKLLSATGPVHPTMSVSAGQGRAYAAACAVYKGT